MFEIIKYSPDLKKKWDDFVKSVRNRTFLFLRDYMEYHADRYTDCSYVFLKKGNIVSVLPGNLYGKFFYTHDGLTFGGFVISDKITITDVIELFNLLNTELKKLV